MIRYFKKRETLVLLCVQVVIMMLGTGVISPILPQYAQSFGVNITMVGLLISGFGVARIIIDIPAASLTDRFGRRNVMIAGAVIQVISSLGSGLSINYWQLLSFRIVQGIGSAAFTTAAIIMLADISSPADRGRVMSFYQGSLLVGIGLGPTLGGFVAQYFGLRAPFFTLTVLSMLAVIWAYLRIPETKRVSERPIAAVFDIKRTSHMSLSSLVALLRNVNFVAISIVSFGIFFMRTGSQNQMLPLLASDRLGSSTGQIGIAMTIMAVFNFVILFTCGSLSDRFGRKMLITPGVVISVVSLAMLSQTYSYWFLILTSILWGIGTGISGPIPTAYVADITPKENYSTGMGLFRAVSDLGIVTGPIMLGWLADTRGYSFSLLFNSVFLLIAIIIFQFLSKEPSRTNVTH